MQNRLNVRQKDYDGSRKTTCCERGKKYHFQKGGGNKYHFRTEIIHTICFEPRTLFNFLYSASHIDQQTSQILVYVNILHLLNTPPTFGNYVSNLKGYHTRLSLARTCVVEWSKIRRRTSDVF